MTSLSEQLSAAPNHYLTAPMNAQLTVLNALTTQALDSASRITALNLSTSQEVLERSAQTARQLIGARDARDLAALRSHAEEQVRSLFAYSRELLGIAAGVQPFLVRSVTPAPMAAPVAEMAQAVTEAGEDASAALQAAAERTIEAVAAAPAPVAEAPAPAPEIETAPAAEAAPQPAPAIEEVASMVQEPAPDDAALNVLSSPAAAKPTPIAQAAGNGAVLAATPLAPAAAPIERRDPDAPATAATPRRRRK